MLGFGFCPAKSLNFFCVLCFAAAHSDFFIVEIIHGGFFSRSGQNRSYLDGKKIFYDYYHLEFAYYKMFEA